MIRHLTWLCVGAVALASPASAADPVAITTHLAKEVLIPRYEAMHVAFAHQDAAWKKGCGDLDSLRAAYNEAADAWAGIEHVKFGPIYKEQRAERIAFWPDPRNATERGLGTLIAAGDEAGLAPEVFAKTSVAVQGLPAIERLLYREDGNPTSLDERRCAIGKAIAANLAGIAHALHVEWTTPETGQLAILEAGSKSAEGAAADKAAATQMLTDLATLFMIVADRKVAPLFGVKGKPPQPKAAEAWRSGRSRRNINLNLDAAEATAKSLAPFAPEESAALVKRIEDAEASLAQNEGNPPGFAAFAGVKVAQYVAIQQLPDALDVPLGFNSLDGD